MAIVTASFVGQRQKVIYCAASIPAFVDIASVMQAEVGWDPCYWIGRSVISDMVAAEFPGTTFHDHHDAIWAKKTSISEEIEIQPLAPDLLRQLLECESLALRMMDRIDYANLLGHEERRQLYLTHVRYWSAILDKFQPDVLFNTATPHQIYDFVLHELCRLRGIRTIMIGLCFDLNRMYCKNDYADGSTSILDIYNSYANNLDNWDGKLVSDIDECLRDMQDRCDHAMPWYIDVLIKEEAKQPPAVTLTKIIRVAFFSIYYCLKSLIYSVSAEPISWKIAASNWEIFKRWLYQELYGPLRVSYLRQYYSRLASTVDLSCPYIYLPLHYQPEMTTVPEGSYFSDQCLVIEMLSKVAPKEWRILVKEHPIQLSYSYGTNRAARSFEFYDRITALQNVTLVPLEISPLTLIDNAEVVATVTGTSGWEALVRGRPVLHFGHPWWKGCSGAFAVNNLQDCEEALNAIRNGFVVDLKLIRLFAHVVDQQSCPADIYRERDLQLRSSREDTRVADHVTVISQVIKTFACS